METEILMIERLIKQGFSNEKLFKIFPKNINYIKEHREFLDDQLKPYCSDKNEKEKFIEEVFELAFGENAINRGFTCSEVLSALKKDSETISNIHQLLDERI